LDLSLRYDDNGTAHDDLHLAFAGQSWVCDSYYFAIDQQVQPDDQSPSKVEAVLCKLLGQWQTAIADLPDTGAAFLPYDFSDQYTGWLHCERDGGEMVLTQGFAPVEGHSFSPSAVGEYLHHLPGFKVAGPTATSTRERVLEAIRASLAETT